MTHLNSGIKALANGVMRGVVTTGVVTEGNISDAVEVMRDEIKTLIGDGAKYEDARALVMAHSINPRYVVALVVANCVQRIGMVS